MESRADFQQTADASAQLRLTFGWLRDLRQDLEQRALAGAVAADDADDIAAAHVKRHVTERPKFCRLLITSFAGHPAHRTLEGVGEGIAQRRMAFAPPELVLLAQAVNSDCKVGHVKRCPRNYVPCGENKKG